MGTARARTYGGTGALLSLISLFSGPAFPMMAVAGLVLIFIAVREISFAVNEKRIFDKYLVSFILSVMVFVGYGAIIVITHSFSLATSYGGKGGTDVLFMDYWIAFIVFATVEIVSKAYLKTSYLLIAHRTGIKAFGKAGFFYLAGTVMTAAVVIFFTFIVTATSRAIDTWPLSFVLYLVLLMCGFGILIVAKIYEIMGYFSLTI